MQIRTLCAIAALLAAPHVVMAQAYNTYVSANASAEVEKSTTSSTYLDVEGLGGGASFATYGAVDFGSLYYGPNQALQGNTIDLYLTDSPYTYTVPGNIDVYLATTPVSNLSTLRFQSSATTSPSPLGVGNALGTLIPLGPTASSITYPASSNTSYLGPNGSYISIATDPSGSTYDYTLTLSPAAVSYFDSALSNPNPSAHLELVITADYSTPNLTASFLGGGSTSLTSPLIGFNTVPEPGAAVPILMGIGTVSLLAARRRKR